MSGVHLRRRADTAHTGTSHDSAILKQVLLARDDAAANIMQVAISMLQPGQAVAPHTHADMWELFLVRSGAIQVTFDERAEVLQADDLIVIPAGTAHGVACAGEETAELLVMGLQAEPPELLPETAG